MTNSPTSRRMAEVATERLGDGQWHLLEPLILELIGLVPPGIAIRQNEKDRRERLSRLGGDPNAPRAYQLPVEERIRSGARRLVQQFLKNRHFEFDRPGVPNKAANADRKVRMVARFTAYERADPLVAQREQFAFRLQQLSSAVEKAMLQLEEAGQHELASALRNTLKEAAVEDE